MVTGFLFRRFKQGLPRKAVWEKVLKRADPIVALALGRNHLHLFLCELSQNLSAYPAGPGVVFRSLFSSANDGDRLEMPGPGGNRGKGSRSLGAIAGAIGSILNISAPVNLPIRKEGGSNPEAGIRSIGSLSGCHCLSDQITHLIFRHRQSPYLYLSQLPSSHHCK